MVQTKTKGSLLSHKKTLAASSSDSNDFGTKSGLAEPTS
jgi:hypothetical protein